MSYIINKRNQLIAKVPEMKSGTSVRFSDNICAEHFDANRTHNLVNAHTGKISNAKKWADVARREGGILSGIEINPGEFHIQ